jgi:hypothetical protein
VVFNRTALPVPVDALDLQTGKRRPLLCLMPPDPVGIAGVFRVELAADGGAYVYSAVRELSELYILTGLK